MDTKHHPELMQALGKHNTGKGCIYVKRLSDIDIAVLEDLTRVCYEELKQQYTVR